MTWQWQLSDLPVDTSVAAQVFDIDLFDNDAAVVAELHRQGKKVICYMSAGSWEDWRPDAASFPSEVIGRAYVGWPGERWLDIRRMDLLIPLMTARLRSCWEKGFDAVEPDNIDGYTQDTGFPLTYDDQLRYNRWLAAQAHSFGLSIGLKNDVEQAVDLEPAFDWALTEDCNAQGWCELLRPFHAAGKAIFAAEYTDNGTSFEQVCLSTQGSGLSFIFKDRDLTAWRKACPDAAPAVNSAGVEGITGAAIVSAP